MRKLSLSLLLVSLLFTLPANAGSAPAPEREWTFLVFLNGNNNLDRFGTKDMNEMEKVGSTDEVNVVVQWASYSSRTVKRVLVQKDTSPSIVTSPVIQDMGPVDMGDWKNLVDFVRWGVEHYPAKHYFIDVWNHGAGWHRKVATQDGRGEIVISDISFDDISGNRITTEELGVAMGEAARIIGHKVDVYGSDACLMAMAEVAGEMSDSVDTFIGSEEVEPGAGWPYDALLKGWNAIPQAKPADVAKVLSREFVRSYQGGSQGTSDVTLSAFDLSRTAELNAAIRGLGEALRTLDAADRSKVVTAINGSLNFAYSDYVDLADFLKALDRANLNARGEVRAAVKSVQEAIASYVIENWVTNGFSRAGGVALWIPSRSYTLSKHQSRYAGLKFNGETAWLDALKHLLQDAQ